MPIEGLHKKYTDFLNHSDLKKSSSFLSKEDAKLYEEQHKKQWKNLLDNYQAIEPSSKLFSSDHEWYKKLRLIRLKKRNLNQYIHQEIQCFLVE